MTVFLPNNITICWQNLGEKSWLGFVHAILILDPGEKFQRLFAAGQAADGKDKAFQAYTPLEMTDPFWAGFATLSDLGGCGF